MDFGLTEQQQMFRDSVAAFARKELAEGALERAHTPHFPHDVAKAMAQAGLLGITLPEADRLAEIIFERRFSQRPPRAPKHGTGKEA